MTATLHDHDRPSPTPRRGLAALVVGALALALLPSASTAQDLDEGATAEVTASDTTSRGPRIEWQSCPNPVDPRGSIECGTIRVPLDHDRPRGARIDVQMVRIQATDQDNKLGSILLNPGGPGGSGVDVVASIGGDYGILWGPEVRERFDLIGFDPRGIARSTPLLCYDSLDDAFQDQPLVPFPLDRAERRNIIESVRSIAGQCRTQGGAIGRHMSTANVARDMDLIRRALGERQLNFFGASYGSYLGTVYANLFPRRVRAVVIDGVLDPVAWVNRPGRVPFSARLGSHDGAQDSLEAFFEMCDAAGPACAFGPDSAARFENIALDLRTNGPLIIRDPQGQFEIRYQDLIGVVLSSLYSSPNFPFIAAELAWLERMLAARTEDGAAPVAAGAHDTDRVRLALEEPDYPNFAEGFPGVACTDTRNPHSFRAWDRAALRTSRDSWFGETWTWISAPCARWPFFDRDAYMGGFRRQTANPVLVVGNTNDPATPLSGAITVDRLLPNSALLQADVTGHVSIGLSFCAGLLQGQYFLDPSVAAAIDGTVCPPEFDPFDLGPLPAPAERVEAILPGAGRAVDANDVDRVAEIRELLLQEAGQP